MDIFFFEAFEEEQDALKKYNDDRFDAGYSWKTIQEYGASEPPAPVISVRTQSKIPAEWSDKLKGILTRSTGYDHLVEYRRETGADNIQYAYLPLYCNRAVAEQGMLLWMALLRKLPKQSAQFKTFNRDGITGRETLNKNLLVVGVGNIGNQIVRIGQGLGMNVKCVDIEKKYDDLEYVQFEDAAEWADIVVCAMNLNSGNYHYFDYGKLKKARPGVLFINISRGEFSPLNDLLKLLDEGHLSGVGMDVYENEKLIGPVLRGEINSDSEEISAVRELLSRDNVIMTPHNAFNTSEAVERKSEQSIQQFEEFTASGLFLWNVPND
jgi:D-lactate dehydrogenase